MRAAVSRAENLPLECDSDTLFSLESACAFFAQNEGERWIFLCVFVFLIYPFWMGAGMIFCPFLEFCFLTKNGSNAESHPREAAPALHRPPTSAAGARVPDNVKSIHYPVAGALILIILLTKRL